MAKKAKLSSLVGNTTNQLTPTEKKRMDRYEIEDALRTVQRAEEIRKDKTLMREVKSMAKEKMSELKKIV